MIFIVAAVACGIFVLWALTGIRRVPTGKVGIVYRKFGRRHPDDRFNVRTYEARGPQADTLRADRVYFRPRFLYSVRYVPQTHVPPGTIGVVVANTGAVTPPSQTLCRSVNCDHFQDGRSFLLNGGQMGRQPDILTSGNYDINPLIFEVLTIDTIGDRHRRGGARRGRPPAGLPTRHGLSAADLREITVPEGTTGVVIALEGVPPDEAHGMCGREVAGHQSFQLTSVFLENQGQRGVQSETLSHGGVYRINPWFARVVLIPTKDLILRWSQKETKPGSNFDAALDRIVIDLEGIRLWSTMSQTIRIPAQSAPGLVSRFGEQETDTFGASDAWNRAPVQRFVEKVLGRVVEGYFQAAASAWDVLSFVAGRDEVRLELEERVRQALAEYGVDAVRTVLNEFESENTDLDQLRWQIAKERERRKVLEYELHNTDLEAKAELIQIDVDRERRKIEVAVLEEQVRILGRDHMALERFFAQLATMNVPDIIGADATSLLNYMPLQVAQDLINKAQHGFGAPEPPAPQLEADTTMRDAGA